VADSCHKTAAEGAATKAAREENALKKAEATVALAEGLKAQAAAAADLATTSTATPTTATATTSKNHDKNNNKKKTTKLILSVLLYFSTPSF